MKIGVLSDTHNHVPRTRAAVKMLADRGCELLLHCGDLTNGKILEVCSRIPMHFVIGNHDIEDELRPAADRLGTVCHGSLMDETWDGNRFMMTHGHLKPLVQQIESESPDFFLTGHSHVAMDIKSESTRRINPGALQRIKVPSVAIIDTKICDAEFLLVPR